MFEYLFEKFNGKVSKDSIKTIFELVSEISKSVTYEDDIEEIDKQIDKEIKDGTLPDPNAIIDPETGMEIDPSSMDLGQPMNEPDLESQGASTEVEMPKGGEI